MNNIFKNISIKKTIITVLVTIVLIFVFATVVELELLFRCEKKVNFEELNMKNLSKFCTIEQLEQLKRNNPNNGIADIKLANLYASLNENSKAIDYYKKALVNTQRSNFSLYSYALFLAQNDFVNMATTLAEEITLDNVKSIEYKTKIYELIGDELLKTGEVDGANKAYQISFKYAKNTKNKELSEKICKKYAESYTYLADKCVEEHNIDDAIFYLKHSFKYKKTALASYKLGLIYRDTDLKTAERYVNFAIKTEPEIVNPYIYYSMLNELYDVANKYNMEAEINYYAVKKKAFNKLLNDFYLYKNDLILTDVNIVSKKKFFSNNVKYYVVFKIKNQTQNDINELFIDLTLITDVEKFVFNKKIVSLASGALASNEEKEFYIELTDEITVEKLQKSNTLLAEFFGRKNIKAPLTIVGIKQIKI